MEIVRNFIGILRQMLSSKGIRPSPERFKLSETGLLQRIFAHYEVFLNSCSIIKD